MFENGIKIRVNIPSRILNIGVLMFFAILFTYMLRSTMSITIMPMTTSTTNQINYNSTLPDYGPRYEWDVKQQGLILSAYFYGYAIGNLPSGHLSETIGPKLLLGITSAICAILTLFTPLAAASFWASFIMRFLIGLFSGCVFPVCYSLIAKWSPPNEKSKFLATLTAGGSVGMSLTWPICGIIIESIGWSYVFYISGGLAFIFSICWLIFVHDSPQKHSKLSPREKEYLKQTIVGISDSAKLVPPFLSILTSIPFWALLILQFGNQWGLNFQLTATPMFLNEVLGFDIGNTGLLSILPNISRFISVVFFGCIGDYVTKKQWISVTCARKLYCIPAHIIPGLLLIGINYVNTNPYHCVIFLTLLSLFNGASILTTMLNSQDLSPNYTATIFGIGNSVGTITGFLTPMVVAHFTKENNTVKEWEIIFIIGGIAYILPTLIFCIFGSGETQSWNEHNHRHLKEQQSTRSVATEQIVPMDIGFSDSHIIPGLLFIGINYVNTNPYHCVLFLTLSAGLNGASMLTIMFNFQDISPNYTATLVGIANSVGTFTGFLAPMVVAHFIKENNTVKEWEIIFIIGGIAYILPTVIFWIFGSSETQSWNEQNHLKAQQNTQSVATEQIVPRDVGLGDCKL